MPKPKSPRHGSMQYWPRKRAARPHARLRSFSDSEGLQAIAGYKMGMTHVKAFDTHKHSPTKNEHVAIPVTIIECPPLRLYSVRAYAQEPHGMKIAKEVIVAGKDKHLHKTVSYKPTADATLDAIEGDYADVRVVLYTQPSLTGTGHKRPRLFEVSLGKGSPADKLSAAKELIGKEIKASEFFKEGDLVDLHAVSTGRGTQGPVKRFGIGLKSHKSEKGQRRPGSLGGWSGQQHVMYRVAQAGQTGYHQRVQYNNQILKITQDPEEINVKGGFIRYGTGRKGNEFLVVRGSIPGPKKRMITIAKPIRQKVEVALPTVDEISLASSQGK